MPVLTEIAQLAVCPPTGGQSEIGLVSDAALAWADGLVRWAGPAGDLPAEFASWPQESAGGRLVIPGLVDAHTHLSFGGDRSGEFMERLRGTSYLEIARRGGGILNTVRATREATEQDLVARGRAVLDRMLGQGVTTVECKSGYGLSLDDELKTLRAYRRLTEEGPQRLVPTLLGAHMVPPAYRESRAEYVRLLTDAVIPATADERLARFCDVFVEDTAFSIEEARAVFEAGLRHGLLPKLHADQLTDTGGAALAAAVGAASADHLECASPEGIAAMARAGTVAVSLPIATLVLNQDPMPARAFIEAGVPVAVATDYNPGSAPVASLPLALWLACTRQRMTPAEALKGATLYAARAVDMDGEVGSLEGGKAADFVVIDAPSVDAWLYNWRENAALRVVIGGETRWAV